jgi:hypothetical protein
VGSYEENLSAGIGDGRPLAAIRFTVFGRLTRKANGPKPIYIYIQLLTAVQIENGEMALGRPVFVDRDPVSHRLKVMYDQQLLSLTEALFCVATTTIWVSYLTRQASKAYSRIIKGQ